MPKPHTHTKCVLLTPNDSQTNSVWFANTKHHSQTNAFCSANKKRSYQTNTVRFTYTKKHISSMTKISSKYKLKSFKYKTKSFKYKTKSFKYKTKSFKYKTKFYKYEKLSRDFWHKFSALLIHTQMPSDPHTC